MQRVSVSHIEFGGTGRDELQHEVVEILLHHGQVVPLAHADEVDAITIYQRCH